MHPADPVSRNVLWAYRFAFEVAAAASETLRLHLALHGVGASGPFRLTLWELTSMGQFGGYEQARRCIAAAGNAGATADAGCGAECSSC